MIGGLGAGALTFVGTGPRAPVGSVGRMEEPVVARGTRARRALVRALRPLPGPPTRAAVLADTALGVFGALLLLSAPLYSALTGQYDAGQALLRGGLGVALAAAAAVLARRHPPAAVVVASLASLWFLPGGLLLLCVAYLAGRRSPDARPVLVLAAVVLLFGTVSLLAGPAPPAESAMAALTLLLNAGPAWLVGAYRRQHAALTAAGWEHARQLRREHRLVAEHARSRERSRIAQDMHDSLGHELSLIALRAGALEVDPGLGGPHREAAADLRATAVTATEHLREVIGVLRTDAGPDPVTPAGEGVADLVERARDSGMRIALVHDVDTAALPPMVGRAVHRVVQESLTNATRYAPGTEVAVSIAGDGERLEVRAVNPVPEGAEGVPHGVGGGRGLIGLRERVRLAGGAFAAGPTGDGAWEVCAVLPLAGGSAPPGEAADEDEDTAIDRLQRAARRRIRGWSVALVAVPVAALAGLAALLLLAASTGIRSTTLEPEEFERLRPGTPQSEVEEVLPPLSVPFDARELAEGAVPEGAVCSYYRSSADLFDAEATFYQLCFSDGRLSGKGEAPIR
ncbi:Signal transduction histidine kinase [Nocardiopsis flavescens]|uniref:histidine kinase n=2 Tax=Nocardiopsis flavescens TaxID=758803 RepID=A0A1M6EK27_9ACTN|nr:Signal transduction histidine kinase [Nocardiopsis flavescens]